MSRKQIIAEQANQNWANRNMFANLEKAWNNHGRPYSKYVLGWWFTQHFSKKTCSQDSPRARACLRRPDLGPIAFWNQPSSVPTILRIVDLKRLNSNNLKLQSRSFLRFIHLATSNFILYKNDNVRTWGNPNPVWAGHSYPHGRDPWRWQNLRLRKQYPQVHHQMPNDFGDEHDALSQSQEPLN